MPYLLFLISILLALPVWAVEALNVQGWARATASKAANGVAYVTIKNSSDLTDQLLSANTLAAKKVSLHKHFMEDGMMKMRAVGSVKFPAYSTVVMKPGGLHLMLMGIKSPLVKGGSLDLTFTFQKAGTFTIPIKILGMGAKGAGDAHEMHGKKKHKH